MAGCGAPAGPARAQAPASSLRGKVQLSENKVFEAPEQNIAIWNLVRRVQRVVFPREPDRFGGVPFRRQSCGSASQRSTEANGDPPKRSASPSPGASSSASGQGSPGRLAPPGRGPRPPPGRGPGPPPGEGFGRSRDASASPPRGSGGPRRKGPSGKFMILCWALSSLAPNKRRRH